MGLRAWTNAFIAANHYYRILASRMENLLPALPMFVICMLSVITSASIGGLANYFIFEIDSESGVCRSIFTLRDSVGHSRFMVTRLLHFASIALTYLVPAMLIRAFYTELLEAFSEFVAPKPVIRETSHASVLDGQLFLFLCAPTHIYTTIQLLFYKTELLHFRVYTRILTAIAGSYCIIYPISSLSLRLIALLRGVFHRE